MKILHVCLVVSNSPQWALRNALQSVAAEYREYSWTEAKQRGEDTEQGIIQAAREFGPDLIFMQLQDNSVISPDGAMELPGVRVAWNGDLRNTTPGWEFPFGRAIDLSLFTNMRDVEALRAEGIAADFLQIGITDDRLFVPIGPTGDWPEIVFLANNYGNMFPLSEYRREIAGFLESRYGSRFAVYGTGWSNTRSLDEAQEAECYRSCKVALNVSHFEIPGYSSDRLYRATGSGAFVLSHRYPEMELTDGEHLVAFDGFSDLADKIDYYLDHGDERQVIADRGCEYALTNCTWSARVEELKRLLVDRYKFSLDFSK